MCKLVFAVEKSTKNTIKFSEQKSGKLTAPAMGTAYVQKAALKAMSWEEGDDIEIEIRPIKKAEPAKTAPKASAKKAAKGAGKKASK